MHTHTSPSTIRRQIRPRAAALAAAFLLSGCGAGSGGSTAPDPTPSPTPSPPPPPTVRLVADRTEILRGESATLSWSSENAVRVVASTFGAGATTGSATVAPVDTTLYTITVADSQGRESDARVTLNVPPVQVSVSPTTPVLDIRGTRAFAATVTGALDLSVTWSVQEAGGGTLTPDGLYTAPTIAGTYHVRATSNADPTRSAVVAVQVRAAGGSVSID